MREFKSHSGLVNPFTKALYKCKALPTYVHLQNETLLNNEVTCMQCKKKVQWNLDLRKPDLRKNFDLRKIVGTTDFLVHKLFDLRKIF